jgi:hypothetical protein
MSTVKNLIGKAFGRLTIESREGSTSYGKALWKCKCDCGNYVVTTTGSLISKNTNSCGCLFKDRVTKHGGYKKGSYNSWRAMTRRCNVPTDKDYPKYGAKGIKVCPQWSEYLQFAADMGEPEGNQTLDRIDPYGNYMPENCRWASLQTQARNIRVPKKSKTGVTGVLIHGGRYYACITVKGKKFYSKVFSSVADAAQARKELELLHWSTTA